VPGKPAGTESGPPLPQLKSLTSLLKPKVVSLYTSIEPGQPAETESGQQLHYSLVSLLKPKVVSLCHKYIAWQAC
jgi:hypothetical protein